QPFRQRLDHDLFRVVHAVHHEAKLAILGLEDDDVDRLLIRAGALALDLQLAVEMDQGDQVAAQAINRSRVNSLNAPTDLLPLEPYQLQQAELGNGVAVAARCHDQRGDDGQGQGDLDLDACA